MKELEKILEEIDLEEKNALLSVEHTTGYKAGALNMANTIRDIIRKHMNDGWIPMEKFGLPKSNEHDFRFWVTIQYTNGFRHTIKAKWDCFDKCFIHQNGKKILQDVIAYKYYSAPEPYQAERSDNNDGE